MVETPAAALMASAFAREVAFVEFGEDSLLFQGVDVAVGRRRCNHRTRDQQRVALADIELRSVRRRRPRSCRTCLRLGPALICLPRQAAKSREPARLQRLPRKAFQAVSRQQACE